MKLESRIRGLKVGALWTICGWLGCGGAGWATLRAADSGRDVLVIYNERVPESRAVASHYADRRGVPEAQVWGFDLPETEEISRQEYLERLEAPLLKRLEAQSVWTFESASDGAPRRLVGSSIRCAALCYGVPLKIRKDEGLMEPEAATLPEELRRNEASVDSQLAALPLTAQQPRIWAGPLANPVYGATNRAAFHPTNGVLLIARLDGPTAEAARGLVDLALAAETNGLWGRAYFDARGITNGGFKLGDDWIRLAQDVCARFGFETALDNAEATWTGGYPMSDVALYAGWYDWNASGPFARPKVDFVPGAFAYHLHSFSAHTLRSKGDNWVGPLVDRGAAATIGFVYEPYLSGTADLPVFFSRWLFQEFALVEAAWASLSTLSWQSVVVGDPLYRPFRRGLPQLHRQLEEAGNPRTAWSQILIVNRNRAMNTPAADLAAHLEKLPLTKQSAVLTEKLAGLYLAQSKLGDAIYTVEDALKRDPSEMQKLRLRLELARLRSYYGPDAKAIEQYRTVLKENAEYPDALAVWKKMLPLARNIGGADLIKECEAAIARLEGAAQPSPAP